MKQIEINKNILNNTIKELKELTKRTGKVPVIITAQQTKKEMI